MRCLNCQKDTPDTDLYCHHCGLKLDLTFDQVQEKFGNEIQTDRISETESFLRWILLILLVATFSGWLFKKLWENPPNPTFTPNYVPAVKTQLNWPEVNKPLVIKE